MDEGLLNKKATFDQIYQETAALILRVNQLLDSVQRNLDLDENHISLVQMQKEQAKRMMESIQQMLTEMEKNQKGFEQKKQVKIAKQSYIKCKDRYQQLNKHSFINEPQEIEENQQHQQQYQQQQQLEFIDLENDLIKERQEDIDRVQKQTHTLNVLVNELGLKVDEQDQQLDLIVHDLQQTKSNVTKANMEIKEAVETQKQSRSKYYILLLIASMLLLGSLGALLIS